MLADHGAKEGAAETPAGSPDPILRDPNPGALRALLHLVYDGSWLLAILIASPWWALRCLTRPAFRHMVAERLTWGLPRRSRAGAPRILVHGVSVGEVKGAAPLVQALVERHPQVEIVISASTDTGVEVARRTFPEHVVVRFPFDPSLLVERFLRRVDPALVVLVELEIWPNFLRSCNRRGLPVVVVNGRITDASFGKYHVFRRALPQFNRISLFCVQIEEYAERFRLLGGAPRRVVVTGNLKADGLAAASKERSATAARDVARWLAPAPGGQVIVAGSTHEPEELALARAWRSHAPAARLILVPRHPPRADELVRQLRAAGFEPQRLTALRAGNEAPDPSRPVLVDTIGDLEAVYSLADVVFVGGSLAPHGGQNVLEPAALGRPVLHGPHVQNFRQEVALLQAAGASRAVADEAELGAALAELLADAGARRAMGEAGRLAVLEQAGATARTLTLLEERCLSRLWGTSG